MTDQERDALLLDLQQGAVKRDALLLDLQQGAVKRDALLLDLQQVMNEIRRDVAELKGDVATITEALVTMRDASQSPMVKDALAALTSP